MGKKNRIGRLSNVFTACPIRVMRIPSHGSSPEQHRHSFQELVIIAGGEGKHWVGDEIHRIETGDVFVLLGDMKHSYKDTRDLFLINILYDMRQINFPTADVGTLPGYHSLFQLEPRMRGRRDFKNRLRLSPEQLDSALRLVAELEDELNSRKPGYYFLATAHLMRLIGFLSRCYTSMETVEGRPFQRLGRLLGHMEKNYAERLSIKDLTRVACMSQTTLMRTFKQLMGRSPIEHLIQLRISKARQLMRHTDLSMTEIAQRTGFCDSNYLARQFRKTVGISPRKFRNQAAAR